MKNASLAVEITNGWAARFALIFHRKPTDNIYMYLSVFLEIKSHGIELPQEVKPNRVIVFVSIRFVLGLL